MILRALMRFAQQEGLLEDPDFEMKPVAWLVRIADGGRLLGIEGTRAQVSDASRPVAKAFSVPRQPGRTSGARSSFLCDKAEYVFGVQPPLRSTDKLRSPEQLAVRFGLFRDQVDACASATGDEAVVALSAFLDNLSAGKQHIELSDEVAPNDLFGFVYAPDVDSLVHQRPKVKAYWKASRLSGEDSSGDVKICAVTGDSFHGVDNVPLLKKVPGGTSSGVALVSFNSRAFESHGWSGNENVPISRGAAEACATALNRLLDPSPPDPRPGRAGSRLPRRSFQVSGDTIVCFWASSIATSPFLDELPFLVTGEDPAKVGELYRSIWKGRTVEVEDSSAFYALTLSGAQGRAVVRDWYETGVANVADNLSRHFGDLDIVRTAVRSEQGADLTPIPLRVMLGALAAQGKRSSVPPQLASQIVRAALQGTPYPGSVLQRCLERTRAEIGAGLGEWQARERFDARASLIKATLRRGSSSMEVTPDMDPTNKSPGYLLGRLMATIERLQQVALGDVNAGVVDRYFGAASVTPRAVFTRLLKNARHHVRKARDGEKKVSGTAYWLDGLIDEIASQFEPQKNGFPAYLPIVEQALFVLGYHHQRHWIWLSKEDRQRWEESRSEGQTTTL